jgi:formylglycine-generating enzyme required for sulfatase activity
MECGIFLCHASEDKPQVRDVYQRLKALGFEPWLDEVDILPGQDWGYEIEQALETSDFVMVFLSTRSVEKVGYVQREFRRALYHAEERPEGFIHTIPVKLDDCPVPSRFSRHQWANLYENGAFERIVRALHYGLQQRGERIPEPLEQDALFVRHITALAAPQERTQTLAPRLTTPRLTNSIGMEFVLIAAGTFLMGSDDGENLEQPVHQVTISQPFYLGRYAVTQEQWVMVIGANRSDFTGDRNRPVEYVSWEDVQDFIQRLNAKERGAIYRLPTEAEWEYACRAGSKTAYSFGDDTRQLREYAWYGENSGTHPVGRKWPNAWGLYDMHGNVWEWVQDWYGKYAPESVTDPQGPTSGSYRVIRGGSWGAGAGYCRSAYRGHGAPGTRAADLGFRLLRTAR